MTLYNSLELMIWTFGCLIHLIFSQIRLRINRNGDLKNLTITNEDRITDNSTEISRWKRSALQLSLSPTPRQKREATEDTSNASSINQTKTGGAGWTSPPRPAESVNFIQSRVSSKSATVNVYEVHVRFFDIIYIDSNFLCWPLSVYF